MSDVETVDGAPSSGKARAKGVDPLVEYMIFHWALGALAGALCVTALLVFDPFGLWPLIHDSGLGFPAIFLLYLGFMTLFGGLGLGRGGDVSAEGRRSAARGLKGQCGAAQPALARVAVRRA